MTIEIIYKDDTDDDIYPNADVVEDCLDGRFVKVQEITEDTDIVTRYDNNAMINADEITKIVPPA